MNFYIIAKAEEHERATSLMCYLEEEGHKCTMDWMYYVRLHSKCPANHFQLAEYGDCDAKGVERAHVIFVFPHKEMDGGKMEMGMCTALNKPVFVMGDIEEFKTPRVPFLHLPNLHFTNEEAVRAFFSR